MDNFKSCNILGVFWLMACGMYITRVAPLSPVHIFYILSILYAFAVLFNAPQKRIYFPALVLFFISLLSIFLILNSDLSITVNFFISLSSPLIVSIFFYKKTISENKINFIFLVYSILFITDGIFRILNPETSNIEKLESLGIAFQIYKVNSIMYSDSNYVGLEALFLFSIYLYIQRFLSKESKIRKVISILFLISILLTFSRSSIFCAILAILFTLLQGNKTTKCLLILILILTAPILTIFIYNYFMSDISFNSKFHILNSAFLYLERASFDEIIMGYGLGNSVLHLGIGAHNLFLTFLLESGLLFFLVFLIFLIFLIKKLGINSFIVLVPFLLSSLSLGTTAIPYFYSFIFLCIFLNDKNLLILKNG